MWLIYGTTLQHWDGQTWTIRDTAPTTGNPAFDSVWEAPNGDVWATMSNGQSGPTAKSAGTRPRKINAP
jgi:hypothetical protein